MFKFLTNKTRKIGTNFSGEGETIDEAIKNLHSNLSLEYTQVDFTIRDYSKQKKLPVPRIIVFPIISSDFNPNVKVSSINNGKYLLEYTVY